MKFSEAWEQLLVGKKIRCKWWASHGFIQQNGDEGFCWANGYVARPITPSELFAEWEVIEDVPIPLKIEPNSYYLTRDGRLAYVHHLDVWPVGNDDSTVVGTLRSPEGNWTRSYWCLSGSYYGNRISDIDLVSHITQEEAQKRL